MKRSKHIKLALVGAIPFALGACGSSEEGVTVSRMSTFDNVQACTDAKIPVDICSSAFMAAMNEHRRIAPVYSTQQSCEADFVKDYCQVTSDGKYMPKLGGFQITAQGEVPAQSAAATGGGSGGAGYRGGGGNDGLLTGILLGQFMSDARSPRYYSEPIYFDRDGRGNFRRSTLAQQIARGKAFSQSEQVLKGGGYTNKTGSVSNALSRQGAINPKPVSIASSSTSRGGFGSQSAARSGWGGGFSFGG